MADTANNAYEAVPFEGLAVLHSHPDRLAVLGTLLGMTPAPANQCRVLELGCGEGVNVVALAAALPGSQFVGLDLSVKSIAKGQEMATALGLKNVSLRVADLNAMPADLGQFDYVIAHGFYSWVPEAVRDRLLAACRAHLAPQGLAYLSYNTYPGSHQREMLREMMLFHVRALPKPAEQIHEAMAFLSYLTDGLPANDPYGAFLRTEVGAMRQRPRSHILHDDLSEIFYPVYLHEFVYHAQQHGLQFAAEADWLEAPEPPFRPAMVEHLAGLARANQIVEREQLIDFLTCRRFRRTLLCHANVKPNWQWKAEQLASFRLASSATSVAPAAGAPAEAPQEFRAPTGATFSAAQPLAKAALAHLVSLWPCSCTFTELSHALSETAGATPAEDFNSKLAATLFAAMRQGVIQLRLSQPVLVRQAGEYPLASALARHQVKSAVKVTSLLHETVTMNELFPRVLLGLLDGSRNRRLLLRDLVPAVTAVRDRLGAKDPDRQDLEAKLKDLPAELDKHLAAFGRFALLVK